MVEFSFSAGFRSFSDIEIESITAQVWLNSRIDPWRTENLLVTIAIADSVEAGEIVESKSYSASASSDLEGSFYPLIVLRGADNRFLDIVLMGDSIDLSTEFLVAELDYLKDTDGDGVGDVHEESEGTDPQDANSTPSDPIIDVLAVHSQTYRQATFEDPITRIRHQFEMANQMLIDSELGLQFRLVGIQEVEGNDANTTVVDTTQVSGARNPAWCRFSRDVRWRRYVDTWLLWFSPDLWNWISWIPSELRQPSKTWRATPEWLVDAQPLER